MADSLKEIILDHREADFPTGVPRRVLVTPVPGKATVCIGPRRSGKTTLLFQLMRRLQSQGVPRQNILYLNFFDDRLRLRIEQAFARFQETGGFPEVAALEPALRVKIHQEYWGAMLFRDLIERHDIAHPRAVADLAHWLADNAASLYSVNRLAGYLKSLGHRVPKAAVSSYLEWFEDAFFLFTVRIFDASLARANANPKKIYCIDHALVRSVSSGILVNAGHLLENLVFAALRRVTSEIFYYKSKAGREVDFIARMPDRSLLAVQVCESLADPRTRQREAMGLRDAMTELDLASGLLVVRDLGPVENDLIPVNGGEIKIVPAWRFLLDLPSPKPLRLG